MTKLEFIELVAEVAVKDWNERRIMLPSVVIAQACKESAFGTSELALNANALFGIKLNGWTGRSYRKKADEQNADGTFRTDTECLWRAYDSWAESIIDHNTYIAERRVGGQIAPNYLSIFGETNVKKVIAGLVGNANRSATAERCTDLELRNYVLAGTTIYGYHTGLNYPQSMLDDYIIKYDLTKYDLANYDEVERMSKKVFLSAGHGGSDAGAVGNGLKEKDINLQIMLGCKAELERHGVTVVCSRTTDADDPVSQEVKEANASGAEVAVSFHTNSDALGKGDGSESFYYKGSVNGKRLAELCEKHVGKLGQNSRGVKTNNLYFTRETKMTAVLCECAFIKTAKDIQIVDTVAEQRAFGVAYAKAILEYLGVAYKAESSDPKKLYKVQVGAYSVKSNADNMLAELKKDGYNGFIVEV